VTGPPMSPRTTQSAFGARVRGAHAGRRGEARALPGLPLSASKAAAARHRDRTAAILSARRPR
jgi:hypothetical protein